VAVYTSSGPAYYRHSDWVGSSRFASTPTRTMYSDGAYGPFGEGYAQTGSSDMTFTGMNQDTVSNLYDFQAREYNPIHGRWPSPDPAGFAAENPNDPQTWNRYAYVMGRPMGLIDATGMVDVSPSLGTCVWDDGSNDASDDWFDNTSSGCAAQGGTFFADDDDEFDPDPDADQAKIALDVQSANDGICPPDALCGAGSPNATVPSDPEDANANALGGALNATGVQSVANLCSIGVVYGGSAIVGAGGAAIAELETVIEAAYESWPNVYQWGVGALGRATTLGMPVGVFLTAPKQNTQKLVNKVSQACDAMQ
jgi:RHS repeat-associated protein